MMRLPGPGATRGTAALICGMGLGTIGIVIDGAGCCMTRGLGRINADSLRLALYNLLNTNIHACRCA